MNNIMEIQERLYSVLMNEEEYNLLQTMYAYTGTKYDQTDQYKQMKDSDILAEKSKSNAGSYVRSAKAGVAGAAGGALVGAGIAAARGASAGGWKGALRALGSSGLKAARNGAIAGGVLGTGAGLAATHQERADNRFANDRLAQAKRQSLRREKKDWRNNTTNRDGYTM